MHTGDLRIPLLNSKKQISLECFLNIKSTDWMQNSRNQLIRTRVAASLWWSRSHCLRGFSSKLPLNLFDLQLGDCWRRPSRKSPLAVLHTWDLPEKTQGSLHAWMGLYPGVSGKPGRVRIAVASTEARPRHPDITGDLQTWVGGLQSEMGWVAAASWHLREPGIRACLIKRGNPFQHCTADLDCFY